MSDKYTDAFGTKFAFHRVPYSGSSTTFQVDQSATVASCIWPASGPTPTLGSASSGLKTVTLAAGGQNSGGFVVIVTAHGKSVGSNKHFPPNN